MSPQSSLTHRPPSQINHKLFLGLISIYGFHEKVTVTYEVFCRSSTSTIGCTLLVDLLFPSVATVLVSMLFALVFFCIVVGVLLVDLLVLVLEISTNIIEESARRTHTNQALFLQQNRIESNRIVYNPYIRIKSNQIKSNQIKSNRIESSTQTFGCDNVFTMKIKN